jgi:DNA-binding NarL/FixJ family response regulator
MKAPIRPRDTITPREWQIMELVRQAYSNEDIGKTLGIARQTVKNHIARIMQKTGGGTRVEVACYTCPYRRED